MRQTRILLAIAMIIPLVGCAPSGYESKVKNKEIVRLVFSEVFSEGNVDLVDELYAADSQAIFLPRLFTVARG